MKTKYISASASAPPGILSPIDQPTYAGARDVVFSLTPSQRALWLVQYASPSAVAYNMAFAWRLRTDQLEVTTMQACVQALADRHEALRTTYELRGNVPVGIVHARHDQPLEVVDATHWEEPRLLRRLSEQAHRPFDLERGPIFRAQLYLRRDGQHLLLLNFHHIIVDAASVALFLTELNALYTAAVRGDVPALEPLSMGLADYAASLDGVLTSPRGEEMLAFWKEHLGGEILPLDLPFDFPRPPFSDFAGDWHHFSLDEDLTARLRELAERQGTTLFRLLLSAFQVLLHRYSGQDDLVVGTAMSARHGPAQRHLFGYFASPVGLRANLSGNPRFVDFLADTDRVVSAALENRDCPLPLLVERLQPRRSPGRSPFFDTMFMLYDDPRVVPWVDGIDGEELVCGTLTYESMAFPRHTAQFDLVLMFAVGERQLRGSLQYSTALFRSTTIQLMADHLRVMLGGIVAKPEAPVGCLPLLVASERSQALAAAHGQRSPRPSNQLLQHRFEAHARAAPGAPALCFDGRWTTYGAVDERATQIADQLRRNGIARGDVVAVCQQRSPDFVSSLLAILKAGAAFLPLDPAGPPDRVRDILADARPRFILVSDADHLGALPPGVRMLRLDDSAADVPTDQSARASANSADPAYVIYTSGSTGQPKGVIVPHRAICNQMTWRQDSFPLASTDAVLQVLPTVFDPAIWDIFGPLSAGARIVLAGPGDERDPASILRLVAEHGVTVLPVVPRLLRLLLAEPFFRRDCARLTRVFTGGEPLPWDLCDALFAASRAELVHLYGPTETAIDATVYVCPRVESETSPRAVIPHLPIGRPIANAEAYMLDRYLQPVPRGHCGVLYLGGDGLADGYLNDSALTADRFVRHPFSEDPAARLYRTGDLVRQLPDGDLVFMGRADRQVKVRGHRVELGDVEAGLARHPAVAECAVVARSDEHQGLRLVAYVVPAAPAAPPAPADLRAFLAERLPDYMLPSAFVPLPALPMTATGKIDRSALPAPSTTAAAANVVQKDDGPRSPLELRLCSLWAELFAVPPTSIQAHFFDSGGDSVLAAAFLTRVERICGERVSLAAFLQEPNIAWLASRLCRPDGGRGSTWTCLVPLRSSGSRPPLFCLAAGDGDLVGFRELAKHLEADQPIFVLRPPSDGDEISPGGSTLDWLIQRYVSEMRSVRPTGPYAVLGYSAGGVVAFELARNLVAAGEVVQPLLLLDSQYPRGLSFLGAGFRLLRRLTLRLPRDRGPALLRRGLLKLDDVGFERTIRVLRRVRPGRYKGRVTLLLGRRSVVRWLGTAAGWGRIAEQLDVALLDAGHSGVLRTPEDREALAAFLTRCLVGCESRAEPRAGILTTAMEVGSVRSPPGPPPGDQADVR
jgi:amino acid adenylation domain-containing protein